jgi:hypothetical protein
MHPIERLRYVARVDGADPGLIAGEAASALGEVAVTDVGGLVPGCRRLIDRHPTNGPLWWLSARLLTAAEPADAAREAAAALAHDPTDRRLAEALPEETSVLAVGWPDIVAETLRRRGDLEILLLDSGGDGSSLARRLLADDATVSVIPDTGAGSAATVAGVVVVEALAAGPGGLLAAPGSHAAAAVAHHAGVPVWAVAGVGRVLPEALWNALLAAVDGSGLEPWDRAAELVPATLVDAVVGPDGPAETSTGLAAATCPVAPELLRRIA